MGYVYKLINTITQDEYIGKSKNPKNRFMKHKSNAKRNGQTYLYRAMRKYGLDNFEMTIIEKCSPDVLNEREIYWIDKIKPCYNMTAGGDGGNTSHSPNYKRANQLSHQNRPPESYASYGMKGKKQSDKWHDAIRKANSKSVICEGVRYSSVGEAQKHYPGIKIRYRLKSEKYPDFSYE